MKTDAHFYAVLGFARAVGFNKECAYKIAYASQFVDDATINHIVLKSFPGGGIDHDVIDGNECFYDMATCHSYSQLKTFNYNSMILNTCAFHFVPGCNGKGKGKSFTKKLRCLEKSRVIEKIVEEAIKEDNVIKFGMVLHPYADTFSHQWFSGILSKVNDIRNCVAKSKIPWSWLDRIKKFGKWIFKKRFDKKFDSLMPAYGHGQAIDYPDLPYLTWSYEYDYSDKYADSYRLYDDIDNKKRYERAFKNIKKYLEEYLKNNPACQDENKKLSNYDILFKTLTIEKTDRGREKKWRKTLSKENLFDKKDSEIKYDKNEWLKEAFKNYKKRKFKNRKVDNVELNINFERSNWYQYYKAVKWYRERFFYYCKQNGLDIPV